MRLSPFPTGPYVIATLMLIGWPVLASQDAQPNDLAARAAAARDAGKLEEALTLYRSALAERPEFNEGRWYVGTLLYELDRYSEAKETFSEVVRREPAHAGALGMKGLCEFELREYDAALVDLLQARREISRDCRRRSLSRRDFADACRRVRGGESNIGRFRCRWY